VSDEHDDDLAERAALGPLSEVLSSRAVWEEPPDLADLLVARISAEAADGRPAPGEADDRAGTLLTAPAPPDDQVGTVVPMRRRRWVTPVLAAVAAAAVAVVAVLVFTGDDDEVFPSGEQFALSGADLAPEAAGTVEVVDRPSGFAIILDVSGLEPAPEGTYYQGWVRNEAGDLVTIGTFHAREPGDRVWLWSGVDVADYPFLSVTLQQEGAGAESSGQRALTADLSGGAAA
jgi:hypothetical protein